MCSWYNCQCQPLSGLRLTKVGPEKAFYFIGQWNSELVVSFSSTPPALSFTFCLIFLSLCLQYYAEVCTKIIFKKLRQNVFFYIKRLKKNLQKFALLYCHTDKEDKKIYMSILLYWTNHKIRMSICTLKSRLRGLCRRFVRHTHHFMGPNYIWHVDGYDKLLSNVTSKCVYSSWCCDWLTTY